MHDQRRTRGPFNKMWLMRHGVAWLVWVPRPNRQQKGRIRRRGVNEDKKNKETIDQFPSSPLRIPPPSIAPGIGFSSSCERQRTMIPCCHHGVPFNPAK